MADVLKMDWNIAKGIDIRDLLSTYLSENTFTYNTINVFDSFSGSDWSGGRERSNTKLTNEEINEVASFYKDMDIGFNIIMSNHLNNDLTGGFMDKLSSEYDEYILQQFHDERNGVIICNENLAIYLKRNYPKYKINYSVINSYIHKITYVSEAEAIDFYKDKVDKFDKVTIPLEFQKNFNILDELDTSKVEVILNDECGHGCNRALHYDIISSENEPNSRDTKKLRRNCVMFDFEKRGPNATEDDIYRWLAHGITKFKLLERTMPLDLIEEVLNKYLITYTET